jgi:hypothetical protein
MTDDHPNVSPADWKSFCQYSSPAVFREIIERGSGAIRWNMLPRARGLAVASDRLLRRANYKPPKFAGHSIKLAYLDRVGPDQLRVFSISERKLWIIDRLIWHG